MGRNHESTRQLQVGLSLLNVDNADAAYHRTRDTPREYNRGQILHKSGKVSNDVD